MVNGLSGIFTGSFMSGLSGINSGTNSNSDKGKDIAILGAMKAFGIKPSGNKDADMQKLMQALKDGKSNGVNPQQKQAISRLMDQMGVEKTGNKDNDMQTLLSKLSEGKENNQTSNSSCGDFLNSIFNNWNMPQSSIFDQGSSKLFGSFMIGL
ncbi:MAG: hypothetical protein AB1782_00485 [Cyanobacteriota bacterium]